MRYLYCTPYTIFPLRLKQTGEKMRFRYFSNRFRSALDVYRVMSIVNSLASPPTVGPSPQENKLDD